jgi:hypothetical protein
MEFTTMIRHFIRLSALCVLSIHSINAYALQEKDEALHNQNDLILSLQKEMRTPRFAREILPNDFSALLQFTTFGSNTNQPPAYLQSVIKLFSNTLKKSHYANACAFSELLADLPRHVAPYFTLPSSRPYITNSALYDATFVDRFNATVNNMLYAQFSIEYESFRKDPNAFLQSISSTIVTLAQEEIAQEQLRQSIIRFCDTALSKLIWDGTTYEKTWHVTKKIADQLATLLEYNILDDTNDLDDLYWTLLSRYCYFIELVATDMPESFYTELRSDLRANSSVLFALKEQDYNIEPKLSYMQRTLVEAETAAYRYRAGLPH